MKKKHYKQFDTLRFLSIIFIILYHYKIHQFPGGFLAVDVFFVLSGFLVAGQLERNFSENKALHLPQKIMHRWRAIFIPMFLFVIAAAILLFLVRPDWLVNIRDGALSSLLFVNNWQQILAGQSYFAQYLSPSVFTHLWYLSVYFQILLAAYLFYAFIRPRLSSRQTFWSAFILSLLSLLLMAVLFRPGEDPSRIYYGTDTRLFAFLIGACFAYLQRTAFYENLQKRARPWMVDAALLVLFALAGWALLNLTDNSALTYRGGMYFFDMVIGAVLLLLTLPKSFISKLLTFKPAVWLGKRTYGAYLWYYLVYVIFYANAQSQNFFTQSIFLQTVLIFILAVLTQDFILGQKFDDWAFKSLKFDVIEPERSKTILNLTRLIAFSLLSLAGLYIIFTASVESAAETAEKEAAQTASENESRNEEQPAISFDSLSEEEIRELFEEYQAGLDEKQLSYYDALTEEEALFAFQSWASFVGDSITLGASDIIYTFFPQSVVTANVGLLFSDAIANISQLKENGQLNPMVFIALGSNGDFSEEQLKEMIDTIGPDHEIYLITTHVNRPWRDSANSVYSNYVERTEAGHVRLIDFNGYYQNHPDSQSWLAEDGVHFNETGMLEWVSYIVKNVYHGE